MEENNLFLKQEDEFLSFIEEDYVALDELVYIASGCNKLIPTEKEYLKTLEFLKYLLSKYQGRLKCLEGPEMKEIKKPTHEIITWLKEMWYAGKYKEIDYGIWFGLE